MGEASPPTKGKKSGIPAVAPIGGKAGGTVGTAGTGTGETPVGPGFVAVNDDGTGGVGDDGTRGPVPRAGAMGIDDGEGPAVGVVGSVGN